LFDILVAFNLAGYIFSGIVAMRSDAPFRDAKAKLMEIRQEQSKRSDRSAGGDNKRKKKTKASTQS
jgi:U3 small nucleolar RNA-associated protein 12